MNAKKFEGLLQDAIEFAGQDDHFHRDGLEDARVRTYEDASMMTLNDGLVVRLPNGDVFQVTILQSERGTPCDEDEDYED